MLFTIISFVKGTNHVEDLADLLQQVARVSKQPGLGLYLIDQELRQTDGSIPWNSATDIRDQNGPIAQLRECS